MCDKWFVLGESTEYAKDVPGGGNRQAAAGRSLDACLIRYSMRSKQKNGVLGWQVAGRLFVEFFCIVMLTFKITMQVFLSVLRSESRQSFSQLTFTLFRLKISF